MNTAKQAVPTEARERAREVLAVKVGQSSGTQWLRGYVQLEADAIIEAMLQFAADQRAEVIEECARIAERFVNMTEASPYWEPRTTECLRQIPQDIRAIAASREEG